MAADEKAPAADQSVESVESLSSTSAVQHSIFGPVVAALGALEQQIQALERRNRAARYEMELREAALTPPPEWWVSDGGTVVWIA